MGALAERKYARIEDAFSPDDRQGIMDAVSFACRVAESKMQSAQSDDERDGWGEKYDEWTSLNEKVSRFC